MVSSEELICTTEYPDVIYEVPHKPMSL